MIEQLVNDLKWLFEESGLTNYRISKDTNLSIQLLDRYKNNPEKIINMTMAKAQVLEEYIKKIRKGI